MNCYPSLKGHNVVYGVVFSQRIKLYEKQFGLGLSQTMKKMRIRRMRADLLISETKGSAVSPSGCAQNRTEPHRTFFISIMALYPELTSIVMEENSSE